MYCAHPDFKEPEKCRRIWRYIDFPQFVNMLETKSLYFIRLDLLDDPHEVSFSWLKLDNKHDKFKRDLVETRREMAVNCWHCNIKQSMAMWQLYARKCYGIAITSTFDDLCKAFTSSHKINIGKVKYWDKAPTSSGSIGIYSGGVLHKRRCYEYEKEVRAVVHDRSLFWDKPTLFGFLDEGKKGVYIPADLQVLIKKIYTSPDSPEWFYELVNNIVKRYKMKFKVYKSNLLKKPNY
jgi:hypothetical protein